MKSQPNYDFYLKLDKWTKKDAALILSGCDPVHYKKLQFNKDAISKELSASFDLYRIFCSVNFHMKYGRDNYPFDYLLECYKKNISLPEPLLAAARKNLQHFQKFEHAISSLENNNVGTREKNYLLKIIGALFSVYVDQKIKLSRSKNTKIPISSVVEDILQFISDHELPASGLGKSNLHQKLSEGLAVFNDEIRTS